MNTVALILRFLSICTVFTHILGTSAITIPFAVSPPDEEYYLDMKRLDPPLADSKGVESSKVKEDICRAIFSGSHFFDTHKVHHVTDTEKLAIGSSVATMRKLNFWRKDPYEYDLQQITVLGRTFHEMMFPCNVWNHDTKSTGKYFVTREYRVRDKTARFVFAYYEQENETLMTAVAEASPEIEDVNLFELDHHALIAENSSSAICKLTTAQRTRLCTIILSAKQYREDVRFPPVENSTDPKCEERELLLKEHNHRHKDWVIECEALQIGSGIPTLYYIFSGKRPGGFFIAQNIKGKDIVVNYCRVPYFTAL